MIRHVVEQGEHLLQIAVKHGFPSIKPIVDLPENRELLQLRPNPNVLNPGDVVVVPDPERREEDAATERRHEFVLAIDTLLLRVKVLDLSHKPVKRGCRFTDSAGTRDLPPKGDLYETPVDPAERQAVMEFTDDLPADPPRRIRLLIGELDPHDTISGVRERLNNLGYITGFTKEVDKQRLQWAVEEFQCDFNERKKKKILPVNGDATHAPTQDALRDEHGV